MRRPAHPGPYPGESTLIRPNNRMFKWSGEFREPHKREYYLSGCDENGRPTAYRAPSNLSTKYYIALPVLMMPCPTCHGCGKVAHDS